MPQAATAAPVPEKGMLLSRLRAREYFPIHPFSFQHFSISVFSISAFSISAFPLRLHPPKASAPPDFHNFKKYFLRADTCLRRGEDAAALVAAR
jgi:hypothetical protein